MFSQTSESAIKLLVYLSLRGEEGPLALRPIAEALELSPSYLEKVSRLLVRAGILRSSRGARGGVGLAASPERITLLSVVEACQGLVLGDYCQEADDLSLVCGFHRAMADLHEAMVGALSRWSVADLAAQPFPSPEIANDVRCRMGNFASFIK